MAAMFPSKRRVRGLDLTFLLDWKKWVWVSEFFSRRRGVVDAQRKVLVSALQWFIVLCSSSEQYGSLNNRIKLAITCVETQNCLT